MSETEQRPPTTHEKPAEETPYEPQEPRTAPDDRPAEEEGEGDEGE